VTDSEREVRFDTVNKPGVSNLLSIQHALTGRAIADLEASYEGRGYGDLKGDTAELAVESIRPIRERAQELMADPAELRRLMTIGAHRARATAAQTLDAVYQRVGFVPMDHP
jgi:tryptophanyl-tRNA synthetase